MAECQNRTLPQKEREKCTADVHIQNVDRENNTVYLAINGYKVRVICKPENDPEVYESIKRIIITSICT